MNPFEFFEDAQAKQHINLSTYAWDILEQDIVEFMNSNPNKISGFINRILEVYLREGLFPADITSSIQSYEKHQRKRLQNINGLSGQSLEEILSILKKDYIHSLLQDFHTEKGIGKKFDVNNACRALLKAKGEFGYETEVFPKRGAYINTILEHYARLPMAEREDIFFRDTITELEYCIHTKRSLYLSTQKYTHQLIPYKIMHDKYNMHTYLVGISFEDEEPKSRLFRISQILRMTRTTSAPLILDVHTRRQIDNEIKQKGVQYLPGETQRIQIRLTSTGQKMYHRITFQRPTYEPQSPEDIRNNIFTFVCTPYQAFVYFKAFGCEAEILSPDSLRNNLIEFYETALSAYHKTE